MVIEWVKVLDDVGPLCHWQCFLLQPSIRLIIHIMGPMIQNSIPKFIIRLLSSQKPHQTEPTLQNQHAWFQRAGDIIGGFLRIFSFLLTTEKICLKCGFEWKIPVHSESSFKTFFFKKMWSKQPICSLRRKYVLSSFQWKIYDCSQWPFIVYSLAKRIHLKQPFCSLWNKICYFVLVLNARIIFRSENRIWK